MCDRAYTYGRARSPAEGMGKVLAVPVETYSFDLDFL